MTIQELYAKRANAWDAAKKWLDEKTDPTTGLMSAEDAAQYDRMDAEIQDYTKQIQRAQNAANIEAQMQQPTTSPILGAPKTGEQTRNEKYSKTFWDAMHSKIMTADIYNALKVGEDANGGFLVPDEYEKQLIDALQEENEIRKIAHRITTSSGEHSIPVVRSHGTAQWIDEEGQYTESNDTFSQVTLGAYKVGTMIKVSEELLHDSAFDLPGYIRNEFARRVGAEEEDKFITGDGNKKPTGVISGVADKTAEIGVTTEDAKKFTAEELMDLYYSLKSPYRKKARFVMNDATIKAIRKLKTQNGEFLWQPSLVGAEPDRLLNKPIVTCAAMPTAETAGAQIILFGDFDYYWIADREGFKVKRLNEAFATTGQVGFLVSKRLDGKLILPEAMKVMKLKAGA